MSEPREYTTEEVRDKFLSHVSRMVDYWLRESRTPATEEKMEGLAFSILTALDGCSADLPGFIVAPSPHADDKEYLRESGKNWYPENTADAITCDIGGGLHEHWHRVRKETRR